MIMKVMIKEDQKLYKKKTLNTNLLILNQIQFQISLNQKRKKKFIQIINIYKKNNQIYSKKFLQKREIIFQRKKVKKVFLIMKQF